MPINSIYDSSNIGISIIVIYYSTIEYYSYTMVL